MDKIKSVYVFGEFSNTLPEGAWGKKLKCQKAKGFYISEELQISIGQRFKFIIDDGE